MTPPKVRATFLGMGKRDTYDSIPKIATACLTFVYTVHTYGLIGVLWSDLSIRMDCYIVTFSALYSFEER